MWPSRISTAPVSIPGRFYPAIPSRPEARPDFTITAQIAQLVDLELESDFPFRVMENIAAAISDYAEVTYDQISAVEEQWPIIGREDVYYGGTTYDNRQGLGYQLQPAVQKGEQVSLEAVQLAEIDGAELVAVPVTILYDRGQTVTPAALLHQRIPGTYFVIHPETADTGITDGALAKIEISGREYEATAVLDETIPQGVVLVPRSMGVPIHGPEAVNLSLVETVAT